MNSRDDHESIIIRLKEIIRERDSDIEKAALFGKQLLEDKDKLTEKIEELLSENESLKQDKYSLKLDLETQVQTVHTQLSELTLQREDYDKLIIKFQALQKESIQQKQTITNLINEKQDLEKTVEEVKSENQSLKKKIALQELSLQSRAELSVNLSIMETAKDEGFDLDYYKMMNMQLQETMSHLQYELEQSKLEENRLSALVAKLEEDVAERDKELKSYSVEIQKARDVASDLQGEIEILKLEQVDVTRRGNSVFGELDDRRKLVEKEYKLLANRYESILKNYEDNKHELSRCKGQIAILLSMTSRHYQDAYINRLEDQLGDAKREIDTLTTRLNQCLKQQQQVKNDLTSFKNDDYDYLRVMLQKAEDKIKSLENDMMTLRLQNISANDSLTSTRRCLYATQENLDAMKLENMKLKQQIKELTVKPDDKAPVKREPKIEYLPWYKPPNSESTETALQQSNKTNISENNESEDTKSTKVEKKSDENSLTSDKLTLKESNKPAEEHSKKGKENSENKLTIYREKNRPLVHKNKRDECRQQ
ncbi:protein Spindly-like [Argiope bruennichi]|uniref:protein Spindly-like n=1 Tax=Argiope bruennichi TaxID=94029 RepID=UPI002495A81E|nr:protein Spindly-like [Argiope bruennichi]